MDLIHLLLLLQRQPRSGERLPLCFLLDGAMGTELVERGAVPGQCLEASNVHAPELVRSVHRDYRTAGADILTANTFGANRARLAEYGLERQVEVYNRIGVELARSEAQGALVAGSIGPSGLQPAPVETGEMVREQAEALHAAGVDLFLCETFGDPAELERAVRAIREVSDRPIAAQLFFTSHKRTPTCDTVEAATRKISALPIQALGVNCVSVMHAKELVDEMRRWTDLPLIAQPNAGQPEITAGKTEYPLTPDALAGAVGMLASRVTLLGGCCGTRPEHMAAARAALDDFLLAQPEGASTC